MFGINTLQFQAFRLFKKFGTPRNFEWIHHFGLFHDWCSTFISFSTLILDFRQERSSESIKECVWILVINFFGSLLILWSCLVFSFANTWSNNFKIFSFRASLEIIHDGILKVKGTSSLKTLFALFADAVLTSCWEVAWFEFIDLGDLTGKLRCL